MHATKKIYTDQPRLRPVEIASDNMLTPPPSVHDTIGDDEIYTRRNEWWDTDDNEEETED